jgi:uncharacterized protein YecA (UPF0149 family)
LLETLPEQTRELIAKARKSDNFKFIISILLALLIYFASTRGDGQSTNDVQHLTNDVEQLSKQLQASNEYEQCLIDQLGPTIRDMSSSSESEKERPQRPVRKQDPCWCGSERKFHKCHGRKQ